MSEPFDDWRNSRNGIVIRQVAIAQVRQAYNLGYADGAGTDVGWLRMHLQRIVNRITDKEDSIDDFVRELRSLALDGLRDEGEKCN